MTNFWRILDNSVAWKKFGFDLKNNGELNIADNNFENKLKVIIYHVLRKEDFSGNKIDSRSLNTNAEKEEYLNSIKNDDYKKVDLAIKEDTIANLLDEKTITFTPSKGKQKINSMSTNRHFLIPKSCRLNIGETKINNIYRELRDNLLLDDTNKSVPNAVGVLFRVFIEISIDFFWEKKVGQVFANNTHLTTKINNVADYLERKSLTTPRQLENIRKVSIGKNNLLAIDNFHSYVHSYKAQPTSSDLILKWDNLQEFFEILWSVTNSSK
ncbi:MAG: hypothetical protein O3B87_02590 [bacterium]|nr:hypothetical protein [bacterium]